MTGPLHFNIFSTSLSRQTLNSSPRVCGEAVIIPFYAGAWFTVVGRAAWHLHEPQPSGHVLKLALPA